MALARRRPPTRRRGLLRRFPLSGFLRTIKTVRDRLQWWDRGFVYLDTVGVTNGAPGLIDARRFTDVNGSTVILVDNYQNLTGHTIAYGGQVYPVASTMISAIEV